MIRIPMFGTQVHLTKHDVEVPRFSETEHTRRLGVIIAPDSSSLFKPYEREPMLKVPIRGHPDEFLLLGANAAAEAAVEGLYQLSWKGSHG